MGSMIEHVNTGTYTVFLGRPYGPYLIAQTTHPATRPSDPVHAELVLPRRAVFTDDDREEASPGAGPRSW